MVNLTVLCVGRLKERWWRDACDEYIKRLSAFCRAEVVEVEEDSIRHQDHLEEVILLVEEDTGKRREEILFFC